MSFYLLRSRVWCLCGTGGDRHTPPESTITCRVTKRTNSPHVAEPDAWDNNLSAFKPTAAHVHTHTQPEGGSSSDTLPGRNTHPPRNGFNRSIAKFTGPNVQAVYGIGEGSVWQGVPARGNTKRLRTTSGAWNMLLQHLCCCHSVICCAQGRKAPIVQGRCWWTQPPFYYAGAHFLSILTHLCELDFVCFLLCFSLFLLIVIALSPINQRTILLRYFSVRERMIVWPFARQEGKWIMFLLQAFSQHKTKLNISAACLDKVCDEILIIKGTPNGYK